MRFGSQRIIFEAESIKTAMYYVSARRYIFFLCRQSIREGYPSTLVSCRLAATRHGGLRSRALT